MNWGGGKKPFSQTSARLASIADFSGSFSPTAELGPRLECLDETPKNVIYIYSPNKSNNGTRGQEGDNHVYFGAPYQYYINPSCNKN